MAIEQTIEKYAVPEPVNILELYYEYREKYPHVFVFRVCDYDFIFRALGRKEWREILDNDQFSDFAKEEIICETCTLYPENFDFSSCEAGVPTELMKLIVKYSYLDSGAARRTILNHYRNEMFDLDNQITCVIAEAFPNFSLEEIEEWDVESAMKYFSRAEWMLHNLRNIPYAGADPTKLSPDDALTAEQQEMLYRQQMEDNNYGDTIDRRVESEPKPQPKEQEKAEKPEEGSKRTIRSGSRKEKLTPEKIRELSQKFPGIDWAHDLGEKGIEGLAQQNANVSAALRVPGQ